MIEKQLGLNPNPQKDPNKCNKSIFLLLVVSKANDLAVTSLPKVLELFSVVARKYRELYGKIPVLIIDNANKLPLEHLWLFQDYAKVASDNGTAIVVFVTNEGSVLRHMIGNSILVIG